MIRNMIEQDASPLVRFVGPDTVRDQNRYPLYPVLLQESLPVGEDGRSAANESISTGVRKYGLHCVHDSSCRRDRLRYCSCCIASTFL